MLAFSARTSLCWVAGIGIQSRYGTDLNHADVSGWRRFPVNFGTGPVRITGRTNLTLVLPHPMVMDDILEDSLTSLLKNIQNPYLLLSL